LIGIGIASIVKRKRTVLTSFEKKGKNGIDFVLRIGMSFD
jgi:hypothetical protein